MRFNSRSTYLKRADVKNAIAKDEKIETLAIKFDDLHDLFEQQGKMTSKPADYEKNKREKSRVKAQLQEAVEANTQRSYTLQYL